jgi:hypothetical protein
MSVMARHRALGAALGALLLAACGTSDPDPLPQACLARAPAIELALQRAPATVRLAGDTPLSRCVSIAAARDGDLQTLGVTLTQVADDLRSSAGTDAAAALRLGYLVGAARRGAAATPGVAAQLARRVEQSAGGDLTGAASRAALQRGIELGEAGG